VVRHDIGTVLEPFIVADSTARRTNF